MNIFLIKYCDVKDWTVVSEELKADDPAKAIFSMDGGGEIWFPNIFFFILFVYNIQG